MNEREWFIRAMECAEIHNLMEIFDLDVLAHYEQLKLEVELEQEREQAKQAALDNLNSRITHWTNANANQQTGQPTVPAPPAPPSLTG